MRTYAAILLAVVSALACATAIDTLPAPRKLEDPSLLYFVQRHSADKQHLDRAIAEALGSRGLKVKHGLAGARPDEIDVLVEYEDRWQWDMSMYLIFLRIDLRDPETSVLLATGNSYQTSAARDTPRRIATTIICAIFTTP